MFCFLKIIIQSENESISKVWIANNSNGNISN